MSPLPAWLQTPPPTLGLQLDAHRVTAVLVERAASPRVIRGVASTVLPPGALVPSLTSANVLQRDVVAHAVREVVAQVGGRHRRVALVVPDTAAKVSLLPLEQVPASTRDLDQLIRLQMRKTMPFAVEDAQIAWSAGPPRAEGTTVVVTAMRRSIVEDYEAVCAVAGLHAGTIDIATFNVLNLAMLGHGEAGAPGDSLLVHVTEGYASVAVARDGGVIFFRTRPSDAAEPVPDVVHQTRMFYEDRLEGQGFTRVLLVAGPDVAAREVLAGEIEARLDTPVTALSLAGVVAFGDRIAASDALVGQIAAPAGLVLREVGA